MSDQQRPELGTVAQRARKAILSLIETGVLVPGSKLPGERQLATQLTVSRSVLRDALLSLAEDGILESFPWRGWFVKSERMVEQVSLRSFTERAHDRGLLPGARVLKHFIRPTTLEEARLLLLPPGAKVLELHRLRTLDTLPACFDLSIIALTRAPELENVDFTDISLYKVLEKESGIRIVRSDYVVRAEPASAEISSHLKIPQDSPVLVGEEIGRDLSGEPIQLGRVVYRSDAYEFQATLFRGL